MRKNNHHRGLYLVITDRQAKKMFNTMCDMISEIAKNKTTYIFLSEVYRLPNKRKMSCWEQTTSVYEKYQKGIIITSLLTKFEKLEQKMKQTHNFFGNGITFSKYIQAKLRGLYHVACSVYWHNLWQHILYTPSTCSMVQIQGWQIYSAVIYNSKRLLVHFT